MSGYSKLSEEEYEELLDPLARELLGGKVQEGETVTVDVGPDGELTFHPHLAEAEVVA